MTTFEAYKLGHDGGTMVRRGRVPPSYPSEIWAGTPQAAAYSLGYHEGFRGRKTWIKKEPTY